MEERELHEILNTTFITFLLTKKCNINCWYCDVGTDDSSHMVTLDEMDKVIRFVNNTEKHNVIFHFFGGEPTVHPHLNELICMVKNGVSKNTDILLTTNLINDISYLPSYVKVTASFHSDNVCDVSGWFDKVVSLHNRGMLYRVVLMVTNDNIEQIKEINEKYKMLPLVVVPIDQHIDDISFKQLFDNIEPEEEELFFDKSDNYMCSSGLIIMENGDVHYCWERLDVPVFNVYKEPDRVISPWHICGRYSHNCDAEVVRCSFKYYNDVMKTMKYDTNKNRRTLFRCNG